jgi:hypothetical protein
VNGAVVYSMIALCTVGAELVMLALLFFLVGEPTSMEEGLGALMTDKSKYGSARLYVGGCISYLFNGLVQSDG